jgi:hypothetical protein
VPSLGSIHSPGSGLVAAAMRHPGGSRAFIAMRRARARTCATSIARSARRFTRQRSSKVSAVFCQLMRAPRATLRQPSPPLRREGAAAADDERPQAFPLSGIRETG